ncbi:Hypothetical predicted protein [Paramuricea clavata]|nr:Hypothetical predicted protein [Paramuricea clavata]
MPIKEALESSSGYVEDVVGTFLGPFVVVIVMIFACVACRRKQKKSRNTHNARIGESENEYQTPDVTIQHGGSSGDTNVYTVPEPNIVYTDLDMLALKSRASESRKPSEPPTQYAIIDEEKLNAARKQRQERLYENSNIQNNTKPAIYDNVNEMNI